MTEEVEIDDGSSSLTAEDYHRLAAERNLRWLGGGQTTEQATELPTAANVPTWWCCGYNAEHRFRTSYEFVRDGFVCPHCRAIADVVAKPKPGGNEIPLRRRPGSLPKGENDYLEVGKARGILWASGVLPANVKLSTLWYCAICHNTWRAKYRNIRQGNGCPECASTRKTSEDYQQFAISRKIEWIGTGDPPPVDEKTSWRCLKCSCVWKARYANIQRGRGCPRCAQAARVAAMNAARARQRKAS